MRAFIVAALVVGYALVPAALQARDDDKDATIHQEFTGIASSIGTPGNPVGQAPVDITITRWSNRDEQRAFLNALSGEGQNAALDRLQDLKPVGTIRINRQGLAYDLRYSQETRRPDGGRRVFLMTDRPISAWEAWAQPRYSDYPFTLITMNLDKDGKGSGSIILAARITGTEDGRFVQVENYATTPIRFNDIKQTK
jgi:hypothetical protein